LNEAERLLLNNWDEAYLLEQSMERVREKYNGLFGEITEAVTQSHPELDAKVAYITQRYTKGSIGLGRKHWPEGASRWPSGFWINGIRLEVLTDESESPPVASVWVPPKILKRLNLDPLALRERLLATAREVFSSDEFDRHIRSDGTGESLVYFNTLTKREVLDLVDADEGKGLVEAITSQFDMMTKLIPALDEIFGHNTVTE